MRLASCAISLALVTGTLLSLSWFIVFPAPNIVLIALAVMILIGALANLRNAT